MKPLDKTAIGQRIRTLREARNLTQRALGDLVGVHLQTINRWENAHRAPEGEDLISLANVFGVALEELLYGGEAPEMDPRLQHFFKSPEGRHLSEEQRLGLQMLLGRNASIDGERIKAALLVLNLTAPDKPAKK